MVHTARRGQRPILPQNSYLIKGIKEGRILAESSILFAFSARNIIHSGHRLRTIDQKLTAPRFWLLNSAHPAPARIIDQSCLYGRLTGDIFTTRPVCADQAMLTVGGPTVALKLVEMSRSAEELQCAISILCDSVKESWQASDDMEKSRQFSVHSRRKLALILAIMSSYRRL